MKYIINKADKDEADVWKAILEWKKLTYTFQRQLSSSTPHVAKDNILPLLQSVHVLT